MSLPEPLRRQLGSFSRTVFTDSRGAAPPLPGERAGKRPARNKHGGGGYRGGRGALASNQDGGAKRRLAAVGAVMGGEGKAPLSQKLRRGGMAEIAATAWRGAPSPSTKPGQRWWKVEMPCTRDLVSPPIVWRGLVNIFWSRAT